MQGLFVLERVIVELHRKVSHYLQPILSHQFLNNFAYSVVDKFNCSEFFDPFPFDFFACVVALKRSNLSPFRMAGL
jgi:hypothetical protein